MKSILFVCSANKDRSKTAEDYFSKHYPDLCFDSAGTNKNTKYYNKITVLNINDIYKYGSKELIEILKTKIIM